MADDPQLPLHPRTHAWVERFLAEGERLDGVTRLKGGWSAEMRSVRVAGPAGGRQLVLRSFVKPFFVRHAPGLLNREADVLRLLDASEVRAARLVAVDPDGTYCARPSLLMTRLPGSIRLDEGDVSSRLPLLARELVRIYGLEVAEEQRPRVYQAWASAESVELPPRTRRPWLWKRAVEVIGQEPPPYVPRFLHRDFHPGNVLFEGAGADLAVSGVVDWVETSWGPAELDLAHCSTNLAFLHGTGTGLAFTGHYLAAGGRLTDDPAARLYWHLLDALAFAPHAEKVGEPWRESGRPDLTEELLAERLEDWLQALFDTYG
ncbi:phosphotransferase [Streptomyces sp. NA04227]|uniref:phosphotransferase family protein n=1 Tax=Streptomyces sp. NA04227 TaxID=2742136 RepID=UPI0015929F2B|nr:phosphotransferase [Streptomyces sp. NA04227]QKW05981.1 phosphotransferase [Streptomyces sp. NA04227]